MLPEFKKTMVPFGGRIALLLLLAGSAGCGGAGVSFNNSISKATRDIKKIGLEFGAALNQNKTNSARLKEAHDKALAEFAVVVKEGKNLQVPELPGAKEYYEAFLALLQVEENIFREDLNNLLVLVNQNKEEEVAGALNNIGKSESPYLDRLILAQKNFAEMNDLKIH